MKHLVGRGGFTIVELLIVVVVIAILAAITLVTFNGISQRAYNTKIVSNVQNYQKALEIYRTQYGSYPKTTPEINGDTVAVVCMGTGYPGGKCGKITNKDISEDPAFNSAIKDIFGSLPVLVNETTLPSGPEAFIGAVYGIDETSGTYSYSRTIQYALHGEDADCAISGAYSYRRTAGVTACEIIIEGITLR